MRKINQIIAASIFIATMLINVQQDKNGNILLFNSLIAETSPYNTGTGTGTGTGEGGTCYKTLQVSCSTTTTKATTEPKTERTRGTGSATGSGTAGGGTSAAPKDPSGSVSSTFNFPKTTTTSGGGTTTTVTKYRADCEGGGDSGCQPTNCEGASVGTYKDCNK